MNFFNIFLSFFTIKFISSPNIANSECFEECYDQTYKGILSMFSLTVPCIQWNKSYPGSISNFCSMNGKEKPWCTIKGGWKFCDIPKCIKNKKSVGCVLNYDYSTTESTATLRWQPPNDVKSIHSYVILLHNSDNICEHFQRQLCESCNTLVSSKIERFYLSCKTGIFRRNITTEATFENLKENHKYSVYIIPMVDSVTIGNIKKILVQTKPLIKPETPTDIKNTKQNLKSLSFKWIKRSHINTKRIADYYIAILTSQKSNIEIYKTVTMTNVEFSNLDICTEYCFQVIAINNYGESKRSSKLCTFTLAPSPGKVKINDIKSGSLSDTIISWTYFRYNECPVYFQVEYASKEQPLLFSPTTELNYYVLPTLKSNTFYTFRVKVETNMKTDNNIMISFSDKKEFIIYADCFNDCYKEEYNGILSMYNLKGHCTPWKNSRFSFQNAVSNICSMNNKMRPWCPTNEGWKFCEIPKCKNDTKSCVTKVNYVTTSTSITIQWNSPKKKTVKDGYLTLLYNIDYVCENYHRQLCDGCKGYVSADIDRFYAPCKNGQHTKSIVNTSHFNNLSKNTNFIVYIIPLIDTWTIGSIKKIFVKTLPTENKYLHIVEFRRIFINFDMKETLSNFSLYFNDSRKDSFLNKVQIPCNFGEVMTTSLDVKKEGIIYKIPFNVSCGMVEPIDVVKNLSVKFENGKCQIYWNVTAKGSHKYIVYWMNNDGYSYKYFESDYPYYVLEHLQIPSWQQICVATIDHKWRTSKYTCNQYSEYPEPVINLRAYSTSKEVYLSWEKMEEDVHHGYVVNVTGPSGPCQTTIINMESFCVNLKTYCSLNSNVRWPFLKSLSLENVISNTKYIISVSSVKYNQISTPSTVIIWTKKEETVENIQVSSNDSHLNIQFNLPKDNDLVIMKYKVKVLIHSLNMCTFKYTVIFDDIINSTSTKISPKIPMTCFGYKIEIYPIPKCFLNQTASFLDFPKNDYISMVARGVFQKITTKPTTLLNVKIRLLSTNLLKASWRNVIPQNECNNFGFMIELISVVNETDCKTWIITRTTCTTMINELNEESKCKNKEYVKYQDGMLESHLLLHGSFKVWNTYTAKAWRITHKTEAILIEEVKYDKEPECFVDCYGSTYTGIRSGTVDGKICLKWKQFLNSSKYSNRRSNMCHFDKNADTLPWCFNENFGHRVTCDVPKCDNFIDEECSRNINFVQSKNNITVNLPLYVTTNNNIRGYIILLHNKRHECEQYIIKVCTNCILLLNMKVNIQSLYMSCHSGSVINDWNQETTFSGLQMHKEYIIYVIPLLTHATIGEILNATVATRISDPINPNLIKLNSKGKFTLQFNWSSYGGKMNRPYINYYIVSLMDMNSKTKVDTKSYEENVVFNNLEPSKRYCFFLTIVYKVGSSVLMDSYCTETLSL